MRRKRALGLDDLHQSELERVLDKAFAGHDDNVGAIVALQTLSSGIRVSLEQAAYLSTLIWCL